MIASNYLCAMCSVNCCIWKPWFFLCINDYGPIMFLSPNLNEGITNILNSWVPSASWCFFFLASASHYKHKHIRIVIALTTKLWLQIIIAPHRLYCCINCIANCCRSCHHIIYYKDHFSNYCRGHIPMRYMLRLFDDC